MEIKMNEIKPLGEENGKDEEVKPRKHRNPFSSEQRKEERHQRQKKRARIVIRNISYKVTEEKLRKYFEQWGAIEELNLLKRPDGKLVGCAFVQYAAVNAATKAILKSNNQAFLGRPIYVDWALGKDEYVAKKKAEGEPEEKKPKLEVKEEEEEEKESKKSGKGVKKKEKDEDNSAGSDEDSEDEEDQSVKSEDDSDEEEEEASDSEREAAASDIKEEETDDDDSVADEDDDKKDVKAKLQLKKVKKEKIISNDVQEGCTVFIKNVPFDAEDIDLRKVCRKFGPLYYAIINKDSISGHSKGTGFVKFKTKESADLCLQSGTEFMLMDQTLDPHPALSRDEMRHQANEKLKRDESQDSRNLYLAREGLIMAGSKAAEGVSASDMTKRHQLEQLKTQVLKNLNRFVSRNRLSIHNLPLNYDNDNLRQMTITYTGSTPHECRVMRENQITAEHPKGKSKGFGFMSFKTHREALSALRKLNNNPKMFGPQHRPIVAFSIEDRSVHKIKEKRIEKSKLNNPTYQEKLQKQKELRKQKAGGKLKVIPKGPLDDNKAKLKKHLKKLEENRAQARQNQNSQKSGEPTETHDDYVGTAAKPGTAIRMRSNKKIIEQSQVHQKRVKADKRKEKQRKIRQIHLAERKAIDRPKQGRKVECDDLSHLVAKYKRMIDKGANDSNTATVGSSGKVKKPKRTKWYQE